MMTTPKHVLIVGGSGMLRGVALEFARRGALVSVVGRRPYRLDELAERAAGFAGRIVGVSVDYRSTDLFAECVDRAILEGGAVELAVCWIHSAAVRAPIVVAELLNAGKASCRYFHVLSSAAADPVGPEPSRADEFKRFANLRYRAIVLGFQIEHGESRWLSNDEISGGVIAAIDADADEAVVGTVTPWNAHP